MLSLFIVFLVINLDRVMSVTVCDSDCTCEYDNKNKQDFSGENVFCVHSNPTILKSNYTLPNRAYLLDISSSNLTTITPSTLLRSKTLKVLILRNNGLTEIDTDAFKMPELKKLDLSENKLQFVHENVFKNLKSLQHLNLGYNNFKTFGQISFHHLANLNELILDNNDIGPSLNEAVLFDRKGYGLTFKVTSLSISGINLSAVPDNLFVNAYDIKKLTISNNRLIETFDFPYTLEYLDISDNPITEVFEEDFSVVPALKELKLNNLRIKEVPDFLFASLRGLLNLELERNRNLTKFSVLAFGQDVLEDSDDFVLETLSLRGSRVTELDERLLEPFGKLMRLDLQGNPWKCDCKLVWLKQLQIVPDDYEYLRCASPKRLYNAEIFKLDVNQFKCPIHKHLIAFSSAAFVFCVLLAFIGLWLFVCLPRYQSRYYIDKNMYAPIFHLQPMN